MARPLRYFRCYIYYYYALIADITGHYAVTYYAIIAIIYASRHTAFYAITILPLLPITCRAPALR